MTRVVVIGGGIAGLTAAWALARDGDDVTLLESSERLGGKIATEDFGGRPVETGPDAFLIRVPHAVELCRELGLADELVHPGSGRAYLWSRNKLRPIPDGTVLGAP